MAENELRPPPGPPVKCVSVFDTLIPVPGHRRLRRGYFLNARILEALCLGLVRSGGTTYQQNSANTTTSLTSGA